MFIRAFVRSSCMSSDNAQPYDSFSAVATLLPSIRDCNFICLNEI